MTVRTWRLVRWADVAPGHCRIARLPTASAMNCSPTCSAWDLQGHLDWPPAMRQRNDCTPCCALRLGFGSFGRRRFRVSSGARHHTTVNLRQIWTLQCRRPSVRLPSGPSLQPLSHRDARCVEVPGSASMEWSRDCALCLSRAC
jgi:hypothetical protein